MVLEFEGAKILYDAMHDLPKREQMEGKDPRRQVQVRIYDGKLYLCLSAQPGGDMMTWEYSAQLTRAQAIELVDALGRGAALTT